MRPRPAPSSDPSGCCGALLEFARLVDIFGSQLNQRLSDAFIGRLLRQLRKALCLRPQTPGLFDHLRSIHRDQLGSLSVSILG
jgi:hypothetical protein